MFEDSLERAYKESIDTELNVAIDTMIDGLDETEIDDLDESEVGSPRFKQSIAEAQAAPDDVTRTKGLLRDAVSMMATTSALMMAAEVLINDAKALADRLGSEAAQVEAARLEARLGHLRADAELEDKMAEIEAELQ